MPPRLRIRHHRRRHRHVVRIEGEIDGSTACQVVLALVQTTPGADEIVLDLSGLTAIDQFGLEVLARGLRPVARARRLRLRSSPRLLPALTYVADSLIAEHSV